MVGDTSDKIGVLIKLICTPNLRLVIPMLVVMAGSCFDLFFQPLPQ